MTAEPQTILDIVLAAAAGTAIAAACGLRAFLPLLILGIGVRTGFVQLAPAGQWIATTPVLITLAWATVIELAADKVPALDHALDAVSTVIRPLAAAAAAWCAFTGLHPALTVAAALVLGGGAFGVHIAKAKLRIGTSLLTFGTLNGFVSLVEDAFALGLAAMAILAPIAAFIAVVLFATLILRVARRAASGPRREQ